MKRIRLLPPNDKLRILLAASCTPSSGVSSFAIIRFEETRTKRFLDFNGDGVTGISAFRPTGSQWLYSGITGGTSQTLAGPLGLASDRLVPADYTGDGRTDVAVFRPSKGEWLVLRSDDGTA